MKNKLPLHRWVFLGINLLLVLAVVFFVTHRHSFIFRFPGLASKNYGKVPSFNLIDRSGRAVSDSDLKDRVWVADFIFTRCADQCPVMTQKASTLSRKMKDVQWVSFSVDPAYDSPSVLKDYAEKFGADRTRWFFLTGKKEVMNRVAQGFHVSDTEHPMFHNISFILVDREGRIRGYYDSSDPEKIKQLEHDAKALLA